MGCSPLPSRFRLTSRFLLIHLVVSRTLRLMRYRSVFVRQPYTVSFVFARVTVEKSSLRSGIELSFGRRSIQHVDLCLDLLEMADVRSFVSFSVMVIKKDDVFSLIFICYNLHIGEAIFFIFFCYFSFYLRNRIQLLEKTSEKILLRHPTSNF